MSSSVAVVLGKPGFAGYSIYEPVFPDGEDLVFESRWSDLAAVQAAFGPQWLEPHLPEGYADLITRCSVHHYYLSGTPSDPAG